MVQLTVKGTRNPDEFLYTCSCKDTCGDLSTRLCRIQNLRHRVKLQLFSVADLMPAAKRANEELAAVYAQRYDAINADMRNARFMVADGVMEAYWQELRDLTTRLFPIECVHAEGEKVAVDKLYEMHDNPDIDEDYRHHIYHCRAILDPEYRANEVLPEATCAMWFNGSAMPSEETIGKYCGNNEKSRITVKLASSGSAAPSKEPRVNYEQQRELNAHFTAKREEFAQLEESELREMALRKAKMEKKAALPSQSASEPRLNLDGVRPIHSGATVTVRDASE
jgi:hypothetical protein